VYYSILLLCWERSVVIDDALFTSCVRQCVPNKSWIASIVDGGMGQATGKATIHDLLLPLSSMGINEVQNMRRRHKRNLVDTFAVKEKEV
jgi:hypothetical protein